MPIECGQLSMHISQVKKLQLCTGWDFLQPISYLIHYAYCVMLVCTCVTNTYITGTQQTPSINKAQFIRLFALQVYNTNYLRFSKYESVFDDVFTQGV